MESRFEEQAGEDPEGLVHCFEEFACSVKMGAAHLNKGGCGEMCVFWD